MTGLRIENDGDLLVLVIDRADTVARLTIDPAHAAILRDQIAFAIPRAEAARLALALL